MGEHIALLPSRHHCSLCGCRPPLDCSHFRRHQPPATSRISLALGESFCPAPSLLTLGSSVRSAMSTADVIFIRAEPPHLPPTQRFDSTGEKAIAMNCPFCLKEVATVEQAIEWDWYPDFSAGEVNYQGPVCPDCCSEFLEMDQNGERVLKSACAVPAGAEPISEFQIRSRIAFRQKFSLGKIVATPEALKAIEDAGQSPDFFLDRHVQGNWGELSDGDRRANDEALANGDRILSAYRTLKGVKIWVITEGTDDDGKRQSTTILRPEEY